MTKIHKESIDRLFDNNFHLETRTIVLCDDEEGNGVGPRMSDIVTKSMRILESHDSEKAITVLLNSQGGDWYHGMAIFNQLEASPCEIIMKVAGSCMSMASVILQSADERILYRDSVVMLHDGTDFYEGDAKNFEAWGNNSKTMRQRMYEIYAERSHYKDTKFWKKKCSSDFIITAVEAVKLGLADRIIGVD